MKITIIKLGYSETFLKDTGEIVSLGDVLRTTPFLHALHERYPRFAQACSPAGEPV